MKHKIGFICHALFLAFAAGLLIAMLRMSFGSDLKMPGVGVYFAFAVPLLATAIAACSCWQDDKVLTERLAWTFTLNGVAWAILLLYFLAGWIGLFPMPPHVETMTTAWLSLGAIFAMFVSGGFGIVLLFTTDHEDG